MSDSDVEEKVSINNNNLIPAEALKIPLNDSNKKNIYSSICFSTKESFQDNYLFKNLYFHGYNIKTSKVDFGLTSSYFLRALLIEYLANEILETLKIYIKTNKISEKEISIYTLFTSLENDTELKLLYNSVVSNSIYLKNLDLFKIEKSIQNVKIKKYFKEIINCKKRGYLFTKISTLSSTIFNQPISNTLAKLIGALVIITYKQFCNIFHDISGKKFSETTYNLSFYPHLLATTKVVFGKNLAKMFLKNLDKYIDYAGDAIKKLLKD